MRVRFLKNWPGHRFGKPGVEMDLPDGVANVLIRKKRIAVEVKPVEAREVEYVVTAVGSVEAFEVVQVTSRVAGVVEQVRFAEGDRVEPSTVLVSIEPGKDKRRLGDGISALTFAKDATLVYAVRITEDGSNDTASILAINFANGDTSELASVSYPHPSVADEAALREALR